MARVRRGTSDNLGLLLDTMCNAFGGVIFIAMLLAVLSQFAEVRSDPALDPLKMKELENRYSQLADKIKDLRLTQETQAKILATMDNVAALTQDLESATERNRQLEKDLDRLRAEDKQIAEIRQRLEAVRKLKNSIQISSKGDVRKLDLPKLTSSSKLTVFFIVKWNRLFLLRKTSAGQVHGPFNVSEVRHDATTYIDGRTVHEYDPVPDRGIPLDNPNWKTSAGVQSILKHVPAKEYSLHFAVYPDSYATLRIVRKFFTDKGYESNWYVMPGQNEKLVLQTGGSGTAPPIQK